MMQLCRSGYLNNTYRSYWSSMGLCYANPPFAQLAKVLTKIALAGARVLLCPEKASGLPTRVLVPCICFGKT